MEPTSATSLSSPRFRIKTLKHILLHPGWFPGVLLLVLVLSALLLIFSLINRPSQLSIKAATLNGPVKISVTPTTSNLDSNANSKVRLHVNTLDYQVSGIQIFLNLTGNLPQNSLLIPSTINGLNLVSQSIQPTATGLEVRLAYITSYDSNYTPPGATQPGGFKPFSTNGQSVELANITFTNPASGQLNLEFNLSLTKIEDAFTFQNLAGTPDTITYSFIPATPPPTQSPTPTPSPVGTPPASNFPGETLTVTKAVLSIGRKTNTLAVEVKSTMGSNSALEVQGYGSLRYNKRTGSFAASFRTTNSPTSVTVVSSSGTSVTVPVTSK